MFYKIEKANNQYRLFLAKKNGLKFKKSFSSAQAIDWFLETYFRHACMACLQNGWVYKTRYSGGLYGGYNRMGAGGRPSEGSRACCPECKAAYVITYDSWKLVLKKEIE